MRSRLVRRAARPRAGPWWRSRLPRASLRACARGWRAPRGCRPRGAHRRRPRGEPPPGARFRAPRCRRSEGRRAAGARLHARAHAGSFVGPPPKARPRVAGHRIRGPHLPPRGCGARARRAGLQALGEPHARAVPQPRRARRARARARRRPRVAPRRCRPECVRRARGVGHAPRRRTRLQPDAGASTYV